MPPFRGAEDLARVTGRDESVRVTPGPAAGQKVPRNVASLPLKKVGTMEPPRSTNSFEGSFREGSSGGHDPQVSRFDCDGRPTTVHRRDPDGAERGAAPGGASSRGDEATFEAILERHGPIVLGVCRRWLTESHDVEDAFQATFLILVKQAGTIRDRDVLGTWLYRVAHRVAARARIEARRRRECEGRGAVGEGAREDEGAGGLSRGAGGVGRAPVDHR